MYSKFLYAWEIEKKQAALAEAERKKLSQRRRKAMGVKGSKGRGDNDDDGASGEGLPEGWPAPIAAEVQLLASMEMPALQLPRHRAGDTTYNQQLQLNLDLAELPDENGWSGLTRQQVDHQA